MQAVVRGRQIQMNLSRIRFQRERLFVGFYGFVRALCSPVSNA
jgi:hypothetical protein